MKRYTLLTALLLVCMAAAAPPWHALLIKVAPALNYYEPLLMAVAEVESRCNPDAVNPAEQAHGALQVRPILLLDYYQRTGIRYTLADMHTWAKARQVFLYYAHGRTYEAAARRWNGRGKKTDAYWAKVQTELNKQFLNL